MKLTCHPYLGSSSRTCIFFDVTYPSHFCCRRFGKTHQSSPPPVDDDDAQVDGPSEDGACDNFTLQVLISVFLIELDKWILGYSLFWSIIVVVV